LDLDVSRRRELVRRYREHLSGLPGLRIPWSEDDVERSSHFGFAILLETRDERDRVARELARGGIQTTRYPALTRLSGWSGHPPCPRTEELADRHLLLPLSGTYGEADVDLVAGHLTTLLRPDA
jgi:dTDP-4-amino-4,6-dideoxygalactose transaminase